ncbi:mannosyltransferase family protein [Streptomyces sp. NPDC087440]|uniref:mannosyltransferase family protein n=1 Tax=Streptomyces sp. NPDC087440 TaxID=3365790 RepID=UPI0038028A82
MTVAPPPRRTAQQPAVPVQRKTAAPGTGSGAGPQKRLPSRLPSRLLSRLLSRLDGTDRDVLWLYLFTRIGLWITSYAVAWVFPGDGDAKKATSALSRWAQWDWTHFLHIAQEGYFPEGTGPGAGPGSEGWDNREAFFPGFPLLLRAVHGVVPSWTLAGLLISFVAGAVAVLALVRIARLGMPGESAASVAGESTASLSGQRSVLFLLLSPCAVFLAAGYTEALFLAFALPAWLAAQKQRWLLAGILTALATTVRISGLFVAAAIGVHFLVTAWRARSARTWRALPWTLLPAVPALLYSGYLFNRTGDWMAWKHAQERGWYRTFHPPWEAWNTTWHAAFDGTYSTGYAFMWQAELVALVVGVALLVALVVLRRWPEAVYVALSLWALATSYWLTSVPRATLLWWPLWTLLAAWSVRRPRVKVAYVAVVAPLMVVFAVSYLSGRWTG